LSEALPPERAGRNSTTLFRFSTREAAVKETSPMDSVSMSRQMFAADAMMDSGDAGIPFYRLHHRKEFLFST
jgi:hypothetical protein